MPATKPQIFLWDAKGNHTNDGQRVYAWDDENRLSGASSFESIATYTYDAQWRRIRKVVNGVTNTFVYDGWNLIAEIQSGTGVSPVTNYYVWGLDLSQSLQGAGGIGGLLCVIRNGTPYIPLVDGNGNITDYVDQQGNVVAHREYDPFGSTVLATGTMVNDFRFWFSSKYLESESGLYYYGYRYYSPETGRWISRDPIGEEGFATANADVGIRGVLVLNTYDFIGNCPIGNWDATGLVCGPWIKVCLPISKVKHEADVPWYFWAPVPGDYTDDLCICFKKKSVWFDVTIGCRSFRHCFTVCPRKTWREDSKSTFYHYTTPKVTLPHDFHKKLGTKGQAECMAACGA
jgi:RHS repeat-associated protein